MMRRKPQGEHMRNLDLTETNLVAGGDDSTVCDSVGDITQGIAAGAAALLSQSNPVLAVFTVPTASEVGELVGTSTCNYIADRVENVGANAVSMMIDQNTWGDIGDL
jgi:hypothetical protein